MPQTNKELSTLLIKAQEVVFSNYQLKFMSLKQILTTESVGLSSLIKGGRLAPPSVFS